MGVPDLIYNPTPPSPRAKKHNPKQKTNKQNKKKTRREGFENVLQRLMALALKR